MLKPIPIATVLLHDRLNERVQALRKENFEDFAFDWLCMREGRRPEVQFEAEDVHDAVYKRIASLRAQDMQVYRPAAENVPFVDFVSSATTWYSAKSEKQNEGCVEISRDDAQRFLTSLEDSMKEMYSNGEVLKIMRDGTVSLTVLTNGSSEARMNGGEQPLKLFGVPVAIETIDITDEMAVQPLDDLVDRTMDLLEEFRMSPLTINHHPIIDNLI